MIMTFEYIGSLFVLTASTMRSFLPNRMILSFSISIIGALLLFIYSLGTQQYGFVLLNLYTIIISIIGIYKWNKIKLILRYGSEINV